jgi:hypothetical protein
MVRAFVFICCVLAFLAWIIIRVVSYVSFDRNCEGYLKRAADANTVEMAAKELDKALQYMESSNLKSGFTSVIYTTPDEDIGFWYNNITASRDELKKLDPKATQLERTNVLMKLRETLLDTGQKTSITAPSGISVYPYNCVLGALLILSLVIGVISLIAVVAKFGDIF